MTREQLDNVFALRARLRELEDQRQTITAASGLGAVRLDGMPRGNHGGVDAVGQLVARLDSIDRNIQRLKDKLAVVAPQVDALASSIRDGRLRLAFRLRFVHGLEWKELYDLAGYSAASTAKIAVSRYLSSLES